MEKKVESDVKISYVEKLLSKIPHTLVIIFGMIVLTIISSYIVPAGMYERVEIDGIVTVVPDSFHYIEQSPVNPFRLFTALYEGMMNATSIIIFILIIGGATGGADRNKGN